MLPPIWGRRCISMVPLTMDVNVEEAHLSVASLLGPFRRDELVFKLSSAIYQGQCCIAHPSEAEEPAGPFSDVSPTLVWVGCMVSRTSLVSQDQDSYEDGTT